MKNYTFWMKSAIVFSLLTAGAHTMSFFATPVPKNETERQLLNLLTTYENDLGAGFTPTTQEITTALSACFTLICFLSGLTFIFLLRKRAPLAIVKGLSGIHAFIFGICFLVMLVFTFLPPILLTGLIFVSFTLAYLRTLKAE